VILKRISLFLCTALSFGTSSLAAQAETPMAVGEIDREISTSAETLLLPEPSLEYQKSSTIAQRDIRLGRLTRFDYSYIGFGFNIGSGDDEDKTIGDAGFIINSKIALNPSLSLRPAMVLSDDSAFLVPVTYDFTIRGSDPFEPVPLVPFIGGGLIFTTENDNNLGFLISTGLDYIFSQKFVANAGLNVGFLEKGTEVGFVLTVGYQL